MTREEAIGKWIYPAIATMWNDKKCKEILEALEQEQTDACDSCEYVYKAEGEEPCKECSHNYLDRWTPKKPSVFDKIRAEIDDYLYNNEFGIDYRVDIANIIDKYRGDKE